MLLFSSRNDAFAHAALVEVWLNLGVVDALSGQIDLAEQAWRKVQQHAPNHPAAGAYLSRLAAAT